MKKCEVFKVYFTCENHIDVYLFDKIAIYIYIYIYIYFYIYLIYIYLYIDDIDECLYIEKADRISE